MFQGVVSPTHWASDSITWNLLLHVNAMENTSPLFITCPQYNKQVVQFHLCNLGGTRRIVRPTYPFAISLLFTYRAAASARLRIGKSIYMSGWVSRACLVSAFAQPEQRGSVQAADIDLG